jgi:hypothetical protein
MELLDFLFIAKFTASKIDRKNREKRAYAELPRSVLHDEYPEVARRWG